MTFKLHPRTHIGAVSLNIRDMQRSLQFYVDTLGFQIHRQNDDTAYLGAGDTDVLILNERPTAPSIEPNAGLFHFAILVPSRRDLAQSLRRLISEDTPLQGFADHLVSEAVYLADPDGIGIEIYRDRPRSEWDTQNGSLRIDTLPLDVQSILDELSPQDTEWKGLANGTSIGHVHLNTGRNPELSKRFYIEQLGFDMMMSMGGYWHFIAAGGYHHHLGLRPAETRQNQASIGLEWYTIDLPDKESLETTIKHIESTGISTTQTAQGYHTYDHAKNGILFRDGSNLTIA